MTPEANAKLAELRAQNDPTPPRTRSYRGAVNVPLKVVVDEHFEVWARARYTDLSAQYPDSEDFCRVALRAHLRAVQREFYAVFKEGVPGVRSVRTDPALVRLRGAIPEVRKEPVNAPRKKFVRSQAKSALPPKWVRPTRPHSTMNKPRK